MSQLASRLRAPEPGWTRLADVVAITASLILLAHLVLGIALALADLLTPPAGHAR